jgi:hypothetical protein
MGYQNNERPKKKSILIIDIDMDLSDLEYDIKKGVSKEQLLVATKFIKKSVKILQKKVLK